MPFHDPAVPSSRWPYGPSASDTAHDVFLAPVRSGKSMFCPKTALPKPTGAAAPLPLPPAAATGGEA